jgi:predicted nucleotidyltransferase
MEIKLNKYGLREKDMDFMIHVFESRPEIESVILYGSRATGQFERGSDVDLALKGKEVNWETISYIHTMLEEESPTLLGFDVLDYDRLRNQKLKEEIDKNGVVIFFRVKNG